MTDAPYSTFEPLVETARKVPPLGVPGTIARRSLAVPLAVSETVSDPPSFKSAESTSAIVPAEFTSTGVLVLFSV